MEAIKTKKPITGQVLPQAIDSEKYVIASILAEGDIAFNQAALKIDSSEEFYRNAHKVLYSAFQALVKDKISIDMITVVNKLRSRSQLEEAGGASYVAELMTNIGSAMNIATHSSVVKQAFIKRELIRINDKYMKVLYDGESDIVNVRDDMDNEISDLFMTATEALSASVAISLTKKMARDIKESTMQPIRLTRTAFDKLIMFAADELIWIGALRKSGKTKTTVTLMTNLLKHNDDVSIRWFSMEDPIEKIWAHFGAIETGIDVTKIIGKNKDGGKLTDDELERFENALDGYADKDMDITYGRKTINKLSTEAKLFVKKRKERFNIIIIDNFYILVNSAKGSNMTEKESYIADKLQDLKTETNKNGVKTVIYVIDHLKKSNEIEAIKQAFRPTQDDLKGSGRKGDVLTQLISINKPSQSVELMTEEETKGKVIIDGKAFNRKTILKKLIIFESLVERDNQNGTMLKMMADLGTMEWMDYNDYIEKAITGKIREKKINDDGLQVIIPDEVPDGQVITEDPLAVNIEEAVMVEEKGIAETKDEKEAVAITFDSDGDDAPF